MDIKSLLECVSIKGLDDIPLGLTNEQIDYYCKLFKRATSDSGILQREVFKLYIEKRPKGQCQIVFPLTELDDICDKVISCLTG